MTLLQTPIPAGTFPRAHFVHLANETSSEIDPVFAKLRGKLTLSEEEIATLEDPLKRIEASQEAIEVHMEKRVAIFFEQLIVCHSTPYHFEIGDTMHQAESTPTLYQRGPLGEIKVLFDSAHSATIPCLYAYDLKEWDAWEKGGKDPTKKPTGFIYLKDSSYYKESNATIGLVKTVNLADIAIDGKKAEDKLRSQALALLNQTAKGILTPQEALTQFIDLALHNVQEAVDEALSPSLKDVLKLYEKVLKELQVKVKEAAFFDRLLFLKFPKTGAGEKLRKSVYPLLFRLLRLSQEKQTLLFRKMAKVAEVINNKERSLNNFDAVFKLTLLQRTANKADKLAFERLFCVSEEQLISDLKSKRITLTQKRLNTPENLSRIDDLIKGLHLDLVDLRKEEDRYRVALFYHTRLAFSLSQKELAKRYVTKFPLKAMSQSGISRIENRKKDLDKSLTDDFSHLLGIDPGLFSLRLFSSM